MLEELLNGAQKYLSEQLSFMLPSTESVSSIFLWGSIPVVFLLGVGMMASSDTSNNKKLDRLIEKCIQQEEEIKSRLEEKEMLLSTVTQLCEELHVQQVELSNKRRPETKRQLNINGHGIFAEVTTEDKGSEDFLIGNANEVPPSPLPKAENSPILSHAQPPKKTIFSEYTQLIDKNERTKSELDQVNEELRELIKEANDALSFSYQGMGN